MTAPTLPGLLPKVWPRHTYAVGLAFAYLVHVAILALFCVSIFPTDMGYLWDQPWLLLGHSDQIFYHELAESLAAFAPTPGKFPLGYPLMLALAIIVFRSTPWPELVLLIIIFQAFVLYGISIFLLGNIAQRVLARRLLAWLSVMFWVLMPLILYGVITLAHSSSLAGSWAAHLLWVQILTEPLTTFLNLLLVWLWFRAADERRLPIILLAGICSGFLWMVRLNAVLLPLWLGLLTLRKRWWLGAGAFAVTTILAYTPQLVFNAHFFGHPLMPGYVFYKPGIDRFGLEHLQQFLAMMWGRAPVVFLVGLMLLIPLIVLGLSWLGRHDKTGSAVVGGWALSYLLLYSFFISAAQGAYVRLLVPAAPALAILGVGFGSYVWHTFKTSRRA